VEKSVIVKEPVVEGVETILDKAIVSTAVPDGAATVYNL